MAEALLDLQRGIVGGGGEKVTAGKPLQPEGEAEVLEAFILVEADDDGGGVDDGRTSGVVSDELVASAGGGG